MKMTQRQRSRRGGFTLMELLLVLAIIGLLMGGVAVGYSSIMDNARATKAETQVNMIMGYIQQYTVKNKGQPPSSSVGLRVLITKGITNDEGILTDPWGEPMEYKVPGTRSKDKFDIFSKGKDKQAGTDDDIGNWESAN
jgi:general secretion pathway protein G